MPEEGQATTVGATVETPAATVAPEGFVGTDGVFVEDWQSKLQDESLRGNETLKTLKNVESLAKSYVHVRKQVPLNKIAIPGVNATDEERSAFHEALGRPPLAEDYVMPVPEEHADYFNEDLIKEARSIFHSSPCGFNQEQVGALWEFEKKRVAAQEKALDDFEEQEKSEAETALRNKWGTAYDENLHLGNRMISENSKDGEERDYLIAEYGNNPRLANFLATVAKKFVEHKIITDVETPSGDLEGRKKELMSSKAYMDVSHPDHKSVADQVRGIFEQLAKMKTG